MGAATGPVMGAPPRVTVVVPVHQDPTGLARCLSALRAQDLPRECFEVLVCDNASTTAPARREDVERADHPRTTLLVTADAGSYRARNACLRVARGDVVAFTDADCTPEPAWLRRGLEALEHEGADIVAGRVEVYTQHRPPTPSELFEVLSAFPQERYVRTLGFGVTANLLVRRPLFDRVGAFSEALLSGGDREFCERAARGGARIAYAPHAVVRHPARAAAAEVAVKTRRVLRGALDAGLAPPTRRQWLRQGVPPLGAARRALAFDSWRDRGAYVVGELTAHYLRWWAWRTVAREHARDQARDQSEHRSRHQVQQCGGVAPPAVVLSNTVVVRSNPWLASWLAASREAGLDVRDLSLRAVLARGADTPLGAHLQWPERALNPASPVRAARNLARLLVFCALLRARRARVVLTAHNVVSHDQRHPLLERVMWAVLARLVTDVHTFSLAGRPEVTARHRALARRTWHEVPHGDYTRVVPEVPARPAARTALGIDAGAPVITSVGALRRYKGAEQLLRAFADLDEPTAVLLLAGAVPDTAEAEELRRLAGRDSRVRLRTGYVEQPDLDAALGACDLVVLAYRRVLNSGSAVLALSAGRRVLLPDTPTFQELAEAVGPGWVILFRGDLTSGDLARALAAPAPTTAPDLRRLSWDGVREGIGQMWGVGA